jgi:hypothetical protein
MPIDQKNEKLFKLAEHIADLEFDRAERLELALDLITGVKVEIAESLDAVVCVAEGQLNVAIHAVTTSAVMIGDVG